MPLEWHPDRFDPAETTAAIAAAMVAPVPVPDDLAVLRTRLEHRGDPALTHLLERAATHPEVEVDESEAARLLEPYLVLLDAIGDGVQLTAAGYLPPALVEHLADRTGVTGWWIGSANREDLTRPLARLRASARTFGLIGVRKGRLTPTAVARRSRQQPVALWRHIVSRLPVGRTDFDRQAGWVTLAVVAGGSPPSTGTPRSPLYYTHSAGAPGTLASSPLPTSPTPPSTSSKCSPGLPAMAGSPANNPL